MRYIDFRTAIETDLRCHPVGRTWAELRERLALPYDRACPTWTRCLEQEIGLIHVKGEGRALIWRLSERKKNPDLHGPTVQIQKRRCGDPPIAR